MAKNGTLPILRRHHNEAATLLIEAGADPEAMVKVFLRYMDEENSKVSRRSYLDNLTPKLSHPGFLSDITPLLVEGTAFAMKDGYAVVKELLLEEGS